MTPDNAPATEPRAAAKSSTRKRKSTRKSLKISHDPEECSHTIFRYTPKRARQICVSCKSVRRISIKADNTATVGPWRPPA